MTDIEKTQPLTIDLLGLLPSKGELLALAPYLKDPENLVRLHCAEEDEKVLDEWFAYCDTIGIDGGALISAITLNATLYLVSDDYQDENLEVDYDAQ